MHCSLLSYAPLTDVARNDLEGRMAEPSRHYHTLAHLELLWQRHLRLKKQIEAGPHGADLLIAYAIAYHDSIFVAGASDNEDRSAGLWLEVSATATNLPMADRLWIADTIRATADHIEAARLIDIASEDGYARQWVLDLDLTPLGESPEVFDDNMDLLLAETAHGTSQQTKDGLLSALRHFASAQPLYRCPPIAAAFERAARSNFCRHLT